MISEASSRTNSRSLIALTVAASVTASVAFGSERCVSTGFEEATSEDCVKITQFAEICDVPDTWQFAVLSPEENESKVFVQPRFTVVFVGFAGQTTQTVSDLQGVVDDMAGRFAGHAPETLEFIDRAAFEAGTCSVAVGEFRYEVEPLLTTSNQNAIAHTYFGAVHKGSNTLIFSVQLGRSTFRPRTEGLENVKDVLTTRLKMQADQ